MPGSLQSGQEGFAARRRDRLLPAHRDAASSLTKSVPDLERFHHLQRITAAELFQHRGKSRMQLTAIYITCHISEVCYIHGQLHHDRQRKAKVRGSLRQACSRLATGNPACCSWQCRSSPRQTKHWHFLGIHTAWGQQGELTVCCAMPGCAQAASGRGSGRTRSAARCSHMVSSDVTAVSNPCVQEYLRATLNTSPSLLSIDTFIAHRSPVSLL